MRAVILLFALSTVAGAANAGFVLHSHDVIGHSHAIDVHLDAGHPHEHGHSHSHDSIGHEHPDFGSVPMLLVPDHLGQTGDDDGHHGSEHIHGLGCCVVAGVLPDQLLVPIPAKRDALSCCLTAVLSPHAPGLLERPPRASAQS